jgi:hypothetical protein
VHEKHLKLKISIILRKILQRLRNQGYRVFCFEQDEFV